MESPTIWHVITQTKHHSPHVCHILGLNKKPLMIFVLHSRRKFVQLLGPEIPSIHGTLSRNRLQHRTRKGVTHHYRLVQGESYWVSSHQLRTSSNLATKDLSWERKKRGQDFCFPSSTDSWPNLVSKYLPQPPPLFWNPKEKTANKRALMDQKWCLGETCCWLGGLFSSSLLLERAFTRCC